MKNLGEETEGNDNKRDQVLRSITLSVGASQTRTCIRITWDRVHTQVLI